MNPIPDIFKTIYSNPYYTIALSIWLLIWKGLALWKAAGKKAKIWFVAILILNTLGLLEIFYLFLFPKIERLLNKKKKI